MKRIGKQIVHAFSCLRFCLPRRRRVEHAFGIVRSSLRISTQRVMGKIHSHATALPAQSLTGGKGAVQSLLRGINTRQRLIRDDNITIPKNPSENWQFMDEASREAIA